MDLVIKAHSELAEYWNGITRIGSVFASGDDFAAFYTSKYLIQDTGEAVWSHMRAGFSRNPMVAYIEFWGVMQALFIQQDAICEIHRAIFGKVPNLPKPSAWHDLRDLRNRSAGHPAKKDGKKGTLRSFMGRMPIYYERIVYEQYDSASRKITHPNIDLRAMIRSYDAQAADILSAVLSEVKLKWP